MSRDLCISCRQPCTDDDYVTCCECEGAYHIGKCSNTAEASFRGKHESARKTWKCQACCAARRRGGAGSTGQPLRDNQRHKSPVSTESHAQPLGALEAKLCDIALRLEKLAGLPDTVSSIEDGMRAMNESVEKLLAKCDELAKENSELRRSNAELEKQNKDLCKRVNAIEQYSRANNVELKGIPVTPKESCELIVQTIGNKIEYPIDLKDIDVCHRVSTPHDPQVKNIVVRFVSRKVRNEFYARAKKARLSTEDLGFPSNVKQPVYINEHLTGANKKLLAQALKLKKEKNWEFVWTEQGQVKARKTSDSNVVRITCEDDLGRIK